MGKKYLEMRSKGKNRIVDAQDLKSIHYFHKKKTPPLPKFPEPELNEPICSSPADTEIPPEESTYRFTERFLP